MNQMNLMNLLRALYDEKIFFSIIGCLLAGIWYMQVHPAGDLAVFGSFSYIFFILVVITMKQMYIDEPICIFKRFFALVNLPDEPLTNANLHRGSFGSLRTEIVMDKKVLTVFLTLLSLALVSCGAPVAQAAEASAPVAQRSLTPAATATATVSPTSTVDWKGTAIVAQATADEARRLDTAATAQEKVRIQEQLSWTAQSDLWTAQSISWTATMALTSIPLTATQQVVVNTQMPIDQALMAGQLTATKEAPTQIVALIDAQNYREYGKWDFIVRIIALGGLSVFLFGMGVFMLRTRNNETPHNVAPAPNNEDLTLLNQKPETVVMVKTDNGQGYGEKLLYTVPCSPAQLSELAERVINKKETLGFNNWEGGKTVLTRAVIGRLRAFFQGNKMAVSAGAGRVVLTENGLAFLRGWLDRNSLPHSYTFAQEKSNMPLSMSHEHDAHAAAHGGGG